MRLLAIPVLLAMTLAYSSATPPRWEPLFDGSSLSAWRGYRATDLPPRGWAVEDGVLYTVKGQPGDIVTREAYGDFELTLEWRTVPGGNSGIFYRATEAEDAIWQSAPEMQILDDAGHPDGRDPKTSAGALYGVVAPTRASAQPVGRWNKVRIVARGTRVEHWLNGRRVLRVDLADSDVRARIAASKFARWPGFAQARRGHIGLQNHGEEASFRDIRIRRLD